MARDKLSEQEWGTFLGLADRLGINLRTLLKEDSRFHDLESAGHALGRAVAQATTERLAFARAERLTGPQPCPSCGRVCPLVYQDRPWRPLMVRLIFTNRFAIARLVAEIFFPQRPVLGLDQRSYSPAVVDKIVSANAEGKSTYKAQKMLRKLAELSVSVPTILDLSSMVGRELREHLEEQAQAHAEQTLQPRHSQARVSDFLNELRAWQLTHPVLVDHKLPDDDPRYRANDNHLPGKQPVTDGLPGVSPPRVAGVLLLG